jgi:hypothetical protein
VVAGRCCLGRAACSSSLFVAVAPFLWPVCGNLGPQLWVARPAKWCCLQLRAVECGAYMVRLPVRRTHQHVVCEGHQHACMERCLCEGHQAGLAGRRHTGNSLRPLVRHTVCVYWPSSLAGCVAGFAGGLAWCCLVQPVAGCQRGCGVNRCKTLGRAPGVSKGQANNMQRAAHARWSCRVLGGSLVGCLARMWVELAVVAHWLLWWQCVATQGTSPVPHLLMVVGNNSLQPMACVNAWWCRRQRRPRMWLAVVGPRFMFAADSLQSD